MVGGGGDSGTAGLGAGSALGLGAAVPAVSPGFETGRPEVAPGEALAAEGACAGGVRVGADAGAAVGADAGAGAGAAAAAGAGAGAGRAGGAGVGTTDCSGAMAAGIWAGGRALSGGR